MNQLRGDLFGRDGHSSMLTLDRYDAGELDDAERHALEDHVEGCAQCRARLGAVQRPTVVPLPRAPATGRSTGSATVAYLVATSAIAVAATAVLWLGAPDWPRRQTAREFPSEPSHGASAYTSVAQEYSETAGLELEVEWGDATLLSPSAAGWLAVVAVEDGGSIVGVVATTRGVEGEVEVELGQRWAGERVVAVLCPRSFVVEVGRPLVPDSTCVTRERGAAR